VPELSEEELDALVEEATVDAYNDEEQLGGFAVMIEDNLETQHQAISVLDLPLPEPPPKGAEWIAAYRRWARYA
jgi:hypothetical protein